VLLRKYLTGNSEFTGTHHTSLYFFLWSSNQQVEDSWPSSLAFSLRSDLLSFVFLKKWMNARRRNSTQSNRSLETSKVMQTLQNSLSHCSMSYVSISSHLVGSNRWSAIILWGRVKLCVVVSHETWRLHTSGQTRHWAVMVITRLQVICEMQNAKLRKGNLRNRLRNALWLVGRN